MVNLATTADLLDEGFTLSAVSAKTLNIDHPDTAGRGPFCRLLVETQAPALPGVYAWVTGDTVRYVGKAKELLQIVHGHRMQRAYNDYTYIPLSKVAQLGNPRVRVNGLLNAALVAGETVSWWWLATPTEAAAFALELVLYDRWKPEWNRATPPG